MAKDIEVAGGALVPLEEITQAANLIAKSGLFGVKTPEQAAALMLVAQSEGLHYARAVLEYDIINSKPALKSSAVLSRFQKAGGVIKYLQATDKVCEVEATHASAGKIVIRWTWEMAVKAGLTGKATWQNYPAAMLRARAVREAITALYPSCLSFYCAEEVQDFNDLGGGEAISAQAEVLPATEQAAETPTANEENAYKIDLGGGANSQDEFLTPEEKVKFTAWWKAQTPQAQDTIISFCKKENISLKKLTREQRERVWLYSDDFQEDFF